MWPVKLHRPCGCAGRAKCTSTEFREDMWAPTASLAAETLEERPQETDTDRQDYLRDWQYSDTLMMTDEGVLKQT